MVHIKYFKMEPIKNGEFLTLRLFTSEDGVRFLCSSSVGNTSGHLKIANCFHLGLSPPYQLRGP